MRVKIKAENVATDQKYQVLYTYGQQMLSPQQ